MNWQQQWEDFAPNFYDGLAHIDLKPLGGLTLLLKPGAGFGDFSHPTTRLMLSMMTPLIKGKIVFDIGCGSGILGLAATLLGATKVYGIDIDKEAIKHSQENAKLNRVEKKVQFSEKLKLSWIPNAPFVVLMNMIESEQRTAWSSLDSLYGKAALVITSGILSSQKESYLKLVKSWGLSLKEKNQEEEWSGFIFIQKKPSLYDPERAF